MTTWATTDDARDLWSGAPMDDDLLESWLAGAQTSCEAYAPALADTDPVPVNYTQAVVLQAREVYEAGSRDGDVIGFEPTGYALRARPLSSTVKQLLRPKRGVPRVG